MSTRFPIDEAPEGREAQKIIGSALANMHGVPAFNWVEQDDSALLGVFGPFSYNAELSKHFFEIAKIVYREETIPERERELVILSLCSIVNAPYAAYSHRLVGAKVGLTKEQIEDALAGKTPSGLTEREDISYRLGRHLTALKDPLEEGLYQEALAKLGKHGLLGVAHTIAGYKWVTMMEHLTAESREDFGPPAASY